MRRIEAPTEDFTGPRFEALDDNAVRPLTEASGRVASIADVPALVERRHGLGPEFEGLWMNGTNSADQNPGEEFVVNDLMSEPIRASWSAQAALGGPLFLVRMMTDQFDDGLGGL